MASDLTRRRASFVYNGARLAAIAANAVVPLPWYEQEASFKRQFYAALERQCGDTRLRSPEELYDAWMQAYFDGGGAYSERFDQDARTRPDLVPFRQLEPQEQDKGAVFLALCEIARLWIRE